MPVSKEPQALSLQAALQAQLPPLAPEDATKPRVLIQGALVLTRDQEDKLVDHIQSRKATLKGDLGLRDFANMEWYKQGVTGNGSHERKYLDQQYAALMSYAMKYEWRPSMLGGIFAESNLHVPITRRIVQQQVAKMIAYITGTEPYFSAYDAGSEDADLAEKIERWVRHTLDTENSTKSDINAGLERAMVTSGAFFALSYQKEYSYYQRRAMVLMVDGKPYLSQKDGDYIIQGEDQFIQLTTPLLDEATQTEIQTPQGGMVLKRDGVTPAPPAESYEEQIIWKRALQREGPKAELLQPGDFLYPLNAPTLDQADILWHRTSETLIQLIHRFSQIDSQSPQQVMERVALMIDRLLPGTDTTPTSSASQSRGELSESQNSLGIDTTEPQLNIDRVCLHYDANQDGNMEDILVIMSDDGYPIAYDFVPNFTPDARRPYRRLRINPVAGRIHGQGNVELLEPLQVDADLVFNRWNFSQSSSGRVTLWRPYNTVQGETNHTLELNNGGTYTPKPGMKKEDVVEYVTLPDVKNMDLKTMLEFIMQIALNMSGVTNVNDAGMVGMDTAKLATGVRNLEKSGDELFSKWLADIVPDVRDLVRSLGVLAVAHVNSPRAFTFFNGDVAVLAEITPQELASLSLHVNIELTRYRGEQQAAQAQSAMTAAQRFYAMPPAIQARLVSLAKQELKAYGVKDVDEIIIPLSMEEYAASLPPAKTSQPGAPAAQGAVPQMPI